MKYTKTKIATFAAVLSLAPQAKANPNSGDRLEDQDTSLHIEAFYQYPLNDNIMITPGLVWLTAPDHNSNNEDVFIATIRTLFSF